MLGAIFQRIRLLAACQEKAQCSFVDNGQDINHAIMLSTIDSQVKEGHPSINLFQQNYRSFLLWQGDPSTYEHMKAKDRERIDRWVDSGGLSNERILSAANELFSPIRSSDFWDVSSTSQVEGAYTVKAWNKGIEPLLSALKQINSERVEKEYDYDVKEVRIQIQKGDAAKMG